MKAVANFHALATNWPKYRIARFWTTHLIKMIMLKFEKYEYNVSDDHPSTYTGYSVDGLMVPILMQLFGTSWRCYSDFMYRKSKISFNFCNFFKFSSQK